LKGRIHIRMERETQNGGVAHETGEGKKTAEKKNGRKRYPQERSKKRSGETTYKNPNATYAEGFSMERQGVELPKKLGK